MNTSAQSVAVLGAGSWGTALAKLVADKGLPTRLWARRAEQAEEIAARHENVGYLPGVALPPSLRCAAELGDCVDASTVAVIVAVPSHGLRPVLRQLREVLAAGTAVVSCTKGIEASTLLRVSEIFASELSAEQHAGFACLGGPSFAREVAVGAPTAVCVASDAPAVAQRVQDLMRTETFRIYTTDDVAGVEIGGALKNVIAIAVGCSDGLGFGHNARAALMTRGLAEMARLATHLGAHPLTIAGLSGLGDLILTCTGEQSRNRRVGVDLGKGKSLEEVLGGMQHMVAEGVRTAQSAHQLAIRDGIDMPIVRQACEVLYEGKEPRAAVADLLARPPRPERN